jgi:hypothetical protein
MYVTRRQANVLAMLTCMVVNVTSARRASMTSHAVVSVCVTDVPMSVKMKRASVLSAVTTLVATTVSGMLVVCLYSVAFTLWSFSNNY